MFDLIEDREYEQAHQYQLEFEQWVREQEEADFVARVAEINGELRLLVAEVDNFDC